MAIQHADLYDIKVFVADDNPKELVLYYKGTPLVQLTLQAAEQLGFDFTQRLVALRSHIF